MDNQQQPRKKPGPNQYDPRSFPTGEVVGIYDPQTYEIDKQKIEKTKQQAWRPKQTEKPRTNQNHIDPLFLA